MSDFYCVTIYILKKVQINSIKLIYNKINLSLILIEELWLVYDTCWKMA